MFDNSKCIFDFKYLDSIPDKRSQYLGLNSNKLKIVFWSKGGLNSNTTQITKYNKIYYKKNYTKMTMEYN